MGLVENFIRSSWERIGSIEDPPSPEPGYIKMLFLCVLLLRMANMMAPLATSPYGYQTHQTYNHIIQHSAVNWTIYDRSPDLAMTLMAFPN